MEIKPYKSINGDRKKRVALFQTLWYQGDMKIRLTTIFLICFTSTLSGCDNPGTDFEKELHEASDGLVKYKKDNTLFTGSIYFPTCEECSEPLLNIWPVHYAGHYKNGKKDGKFWYPKSGRNDDSFNYSERNDQKVIVYKNGKVVN